jgi:hypothetical protein
MKFIAFCRVDMLFALQIARRKKVRRAAGGTS